jgi:hypothetical protein
MIAEGDRRQPARSVLAAIRRCGHAHSRRDPMLNAVNNVLGNDY